MYLLDAPLPQCLNSGFGGTSSSNDRIEDNRNVTRGSIFAIGRLDAGRQVVVILDWLERGHLAEQPQMVDRNRDRKESLESCSPRDQYPSRYLRTAETKQKKRGKGGKHKPSTMPNPLLNTGTSAMLFGLMFCTSNDAPMGVMPATPVSWVVRKAPNASTARNSEISWTSALVSFGDVLAERSCESFASRQGCVETCTLEGREDMVSYVGVVVVV